MLRLVLTVLLLLSLGYAVPSHPVDEVVFAENTTTGMELSIFVYKSGYSYGNTYGLERRATLRVPFSAQLLLADVDGDSVAEVVAVVGDVEGLTLEFYRYIAEENRLMRLGEARLRGAAGSWFAGDVDGNGRDELMRLLPAAGWTEVYVYSYAPGFLSGYAEGLRQLDVLRYGGDGGVWFAGDVDGDGRDELILAEDAISGTRFTFFSYDPGYALGNTEKLRRSGEAEHYLKASWFAGDVDGDGRDELIGVEQDYETRLRITRYEPGYEYGSTLGLRGVEVVRHYQLSPVLLAGNLVGALEVTSRQPAQEVVRVPSGGRVLFSVEAEHTDGVEVSYLWRFNGREVSRSGEFEYTAELGGGVVECLVSAASSSRVIRWVVEVPAEVEEASRENTPPEVEILSPANGTVATGGVVVRWAVRDREGDRVSVAVRLRSQEGVRELYTAQGAEGSYLLDASALEPGSYLLQVEASDGRSTATAEVSLVVPRREAPPAPQALLVVTTTPPGAEVYVNGERLGVTNTELRLPPGRYTLRLEKSGYLPYEAEVELTAGESTTLEVRLVRKIFGLSPGAFFLVALILSGVGVALVYRAAVALREHLRTPREELE
ncbi:MAG: PEGA domain-containing protein [Euryarchaeota archaeon]|nr:PEGA domain-containing protein [Euryarchaeota archaeon]